jgi:hypothetical protein
VELLLNTDTNWKSFAANSSVWRLWPAVWQLRGTALNATSTASIRYTTGLKFVVMRGQSIKSGAKSMQYPANAELLRGHEEFRALLEEERCAGDDYIEDRATRMLEIEGNGEGMGNSTTWLQASLNRHWSPTETAFHPVRVLRWWRTHRRISSTPAISTMRRCKTALDLERNRAVRL